MIICILRTLIVYTAIMLSMRIMGKRQIAQLAPSELVVAVLISDLAANPLQDNCTPLLYGLLPIVVLICCEILLSALINKSVKFRAFLCGKPSMIISNGKVDQAQMIKNRYTPDDLQEALRQQGVYDINTVMNAVLEVNGTLSVLLKNDCAPLTPKDAGISVTLDCYPLTVISEGRILSQNLKLLGRDEHWLNRMLKKHGVSEAAEVYLLTCDSNDKTYFVKWCKNES